MTNSRKIEVLARLDDTYIRPRADKDGWTLMRKGIAISGGSKSLCEQRLQEECCKLLNSYDAIIPLVVKWCDKPMKWQYFTERLFGTCRYELSNISIVVCVLLKCKPVELCDALIKAAGQWEEE